jgi:hypothetical protein
MAAPATRKLPKDFLWGFATGMSPFPARVRREEGRGTQLMSRLPYYAPFGNLTAFFRSLLSN